MTATRKLLLILAALLAMVGLMAGAQQGATAAPQAPAKAAAPTEHTKVAGVAAPADTADFTLDVCRFTNPNPSGYIEANWRLEVYLTTPVIISGGVNIHQHIKPWCRWVPTRAPNYGPLCRVIHRHNNPTNLLPPGDDWLWHVVIDYWSCPTRPW